MIKRSGNRIPADRRTIIVNHFNPKTKKDAKGITIRFTSPDDAILAASRVLSNALAWKSNPEGFGKELWITALEHHGRENAEFHVQIAVDENVQPLLSQRPLTLDKK